MAGDGNDGAPARPPGARRGLALTSAGAAYLALAVAIWWEVWSGHPTTTTTCGCGSSFSA